MEGASWDSLTPEQKAELLQNPYFDAGIWLAGIAAAIIVLVLISYLDGDEPNG